MLDTRTSTELLEALRRSDGDDAWAALSERYRPVIERFGRRLGLDTEDARDAAQSTLTEFLRSYRGGAYERHRGRLRSWIFGIARHEIARIRRRRRPDVAESTTFDDAPAPLEDVWEREWTAELLRASLRRVRTEVDHLTFDAFERFALREHDVRAVAEDLGLSVNAVYGAKRRVLDRLRAQMTDLTESY